MTHKKHKNSSIQQDPEVTVTRYQCTDYDSNIHLTETNGI